MGIHTEEVGEVEREKWEKEVLRVRVGNLKKIGTGIICHQIFKKIHLEVETVKYIWIYCTGARCLVI
jgi:hypothetical protein